MKQVIHILASITFLWACSTMTGCDQKSESSKETDAAQASAPLPKDLFVDTAPDHARSVAEIKADADANGEVVIRGRIGGRKEPFVKGMAVFILADTSMKACNQMEGDTCKTPWDYCCEPRESLNANTATIQIVDTDGKPLHANLTGQQGLSELAEVTIAGTVTKREASGLLVITAQHIYVKPDAG